MPDESDIVDDDDDDDDDDDAGAATEPCPFCHEPVHPDADLCPHCRNFIAIADLPRRRPWWFYVALALCLLTVLMWALFG
jgi:hypothetical protein